MKHEDILRMAREAGGGLESDYANISALERFAALVAEQERQDCARVVMSFKNWSRVDLLPIAEAIKSRRLDINRGQA